MKNIIYILIPGIRTNANSLTLWTHFGVNWINRNTGDNVKAIEFNYHTGVLTRFIKQNERAQQLVTIINGYKNDGYKVVLIGHSNGTDLIGKALSMNVFIDTIHLISPAAFESDYVKALRENVVKNIHIYGSSSDEALLFSKRTFFITKIFSFFSRLICGPRLGYGTLGLNGKHFEEKFPEIVKDHSINTYGHSTWLDDDHLIETLELIISNDKLDSERNKK